MPDDGTCELKHVAQCHVTLQCGAGRRISGLCDIEKHSGMYQNKNNRIKLINF
jgi:hypothetical protein